MTRAALRLGRSRDAEKSQEATAKLSPATGKKADFSSQGQWRPGSGRAENWFGEPVHPEGSVHISLQSASDSLSPLQEGEHWMALFKPAHWQVSVDAKEA